MAIVDKTEFASQNGDVPFLPSHAFAVTASDATRYTPGIAVFAGVAGTVVIIPARGDGTTAITFTVPAGGLVPCRAAAVMAGSTATGLVGVV